MLNIYEEYESPEEREATLALESAEIAMDRALLAADTACKMKEIKMREAELKFVQESGDDGCDFDRLCDYYEEAAEQNQDNSQGIIAKAWAAIKAFFTNIKNKLFGKAEDNIDPNKKYKVKKSDLEDANKLAQAWDKLKGALGHPFKLAVTVVGVVATIIGGVVILKKVKDGKEDNSTVEKKGIELKGLFDRFKKIHADMINSTKTAAANDDNSETGGKIKGFFKSIGTGISNLWTSLLAAMGLKSAPESDTGDKNEVKPGDQTPTKDAAKENGKQIKKDLQKQGKVLNDDGSINVKASEDNYNDSAEDFESLDSFEALFEESGDFADTPEIDGELSELIACL